MLNPVTNPYGESYLMWDNLYGAEQLFQGAGAVNTLGDTVAYKEYDIRSHRKLNNMSETLWLQIAQEGNALTTGFSFTQSTLIRLP
jgi:hypothetical protein